MTTDYVIGIDLGTTNTVVAFVRLQADQPAIELLPIPQLTAANTLESRVQLPSFLYLATDAERQSGVWRLPWDDSGVFCAGMAARSLSAQAPERTIAAAKSWLCHSRVDRRQPILPWQAPANVPKMSPVDASRRLLEHVAAVWEQVHPQHPFGEQQIVLTVPASFDASARELTREAALAAGCPESLVLLEEPQAATYNWLHTVGDRWRKILRVGERLLVCDVGGGTTDLTLVEAAEDKGGLVLRRIAVGPHLLVGGDNMDAALAHAAAGLFQEQGVSLDPWQSISLWHACRQAKESLLSASGRESETISVPGRGSRLIGGLISVSLPRTLAQDLLIHGFFPPTQLTDRPQKSRSSGFREAGLPWESDGAITRHLAAFLQQASDGAAPASVLFNGGVFRSVALRTRLLEQLQEWYPDKPPLPVEGGEDLDFAVARGACFYGWSRHHGGVRIRGGAARSYYVGIETAGLAVPGLGRPLKALCVVPQGMEEGTTAEIPGEAVGLSVGAPERFRFFSSAVRRDDQPGTELRRWSAEELSETDSLELSLAADEETDDGWVPVQFQSRITELGVLELWCVHEASGRRWKLEFSIREDAG
ncbi:MAG: Hsp70 family protein [Planctomycetota bacterium]